MLHKDLDAWKRAIEFITDIYIITKKFPEEERFSLVSQLRRSATSIASNIAEGSGRNSDKELIQFLYIALGSAAETETQLIIASRIGYIENGHNIFTKLEEIRKPLSGLINYLKKKRK